MTFDFRYPMITGATEKEQLAQMKAYIHQLVDELKWALNSVELPQSNVVVIQQKPGNANSGIATMSMDEMNEPASTAVDFVTEIGVHTIDANSYWRYRKWKSGAVDLNGVFKVTPELDGTFSSIVRYSKQIQIPLPFKVETFQFVGTPATNYYLLTNAAINTDTDGNNSVAFRLLRFTDFAGDSTSVRIMASGKIK